MPSVLIVGTGAVGLVLANYLRRVKSVELGLIARSNYDDIKASGVNVEVKDIGKSYNWQPDSLIRDAEKATFADAKVYDYVVIATKTGSKPVDGLENYIGPETLVILAQNGIGIEAPYIEEYKGVNLVSTIVKVAASVTSGATAIQFKDWLQITAGFVTNSPSLQPKLEEFVKICENEGVSISVSESISLDRWEKLLWNGTFNTITAITDLPIHDVFASGLEDLCTNVMTEIWQIAEADLGPDNWLPRTVIKQLIDTTKEFPAGGFLPSTLQDVRKGKEIEFETLTGNAVRLAHEKGVPIPHLEVIYQLLKAVNHRMIVNKKSSL